MKTCKIMLYFKTGIISAYSNMTFCSQCHYEHISESAMCRMLIDSREIN